MQRHFLLLGVISLTLGACAQEPKIKNDRIIFLSGKTITYTTNSGILRGPDESAKENKPVSLQEESILLRDWKRVIFIRHMMFGYEEGANEITVYDYQGKALSPTVTFDGIVIFLKKTKRILLAQKSAHYRIESSLLLNQDGNLVRDIPQSQTIFDFKVSDDGRVIWFLESGFRNERYITKVRTFDSDGKSIKEFESDKAGPVQTEFGNKVYQITLVEPQMPG